MVKPRWYHDAFVMPGETVAFVVAIIVAALGAALLNNAAGQL
ncbi:MAG: hypothetical protein ACKOEC_16540 [Acidimicrobiia bacterium]